jgi:hypothetical protein
MLHSEQCSVNDLRNNYSLILPRVTVPKTRVWIVIGFIGYLQVVTTDNYNTIAVPHNLQSLHTNLLSTHKVFKSHVKSSQADFLHSSSAKNFPWLSPTEN